MRTWTVREQIHVDQRKTQSEASRKKITPFTCRNGIMEVLSAGADQNLAELFSSAIAQLEIFLQLVGLCRRHEKKAKKTKKKKKDIEMFY